MSLVVALVGKQNVGKSTLFNRIINKKLAIVDDKPGVTRDRILGHAKWLNKQFSLIDTGGLSNGDFSFKNNIKLQVETAIEQADLILFVASAKDGVNQDDFYVSKLLKKNKTKKVILVVNKSESIKNINVNNYFALGFGKPFFVSAEHSIGIGDMLDEVCKLNVSVQNEKKSFAFSIIGKTNVGKSTLLNSIINEERVIVSPIPHTTRDAIDVDFTYHKENYTIIDTAGIRRKGKITDNIEKYAIMRTENAVERSNLVILMLDGSVPFTEQDETIGGIAFKSNLPTIICVNK
jgi:GTP-binding protein